MNNPLTNFHTPDASNVERLRAILEAERQLPVSSEEAAEIATQLLSLYECLARDRKQEKVALHDD